jgi:hypothetical protein
MSANTFWVAFHRPNGITPEMARKIANVLVGWSRHMRETADRLFTLAAAYDQKEKST